jgi:hypothetical protein
MHTDPHHQHHHHQNHPFDTTPPEYYQTTLPQNRKTNAYWGDQRPETKNDSNFRAYFQNVNTLPLHQDEAAPIYQFLADQGVDLFAFAETNTEWLNKATLGKFQQSVRKQWTHHQTSTSTSSTAFEGTRKPGGTAMGTVGKWSCSFEERGSDPAGLGRWSYIRIRGRQNRQVVFVTAYQVSQKYGTHVGPTTAYHQQAALLRQHGHLEPNPRKAFYADLTNTITAWKAKNYSVVVMLDANDTLGTGKGGLEDLVNACSLHDVHTLRHTSPSPPTYLRSPRRIDYILCTGDITHSVVASGIDPFLSGIPSDHRGLWVDFDIHALFHGRMDDPTHAATRRLISKNEAHATRFTEIVWQQLSSRQITARVTKLTVRFASDTKTIDGPAHIEPIDRDFTRAMRHAEKIACSRSASYPWSPELAVATATVAFWRIQQSIIKNNVDGPDLTELRTKARLGPTAGQDTPLKEVRRLYRAALQHRATCRRESPTLRSDHLRRQADHALSEGRKKDYKAINGILRSEQRASSFRKIKRHYKPATTGAVSTIEVLVPGTTNTYQVISDPDDVEERILIRNIAHFGQAKTTPFGHGPLAGILGLTGTNGFAQTVLDGDTLPTIVDTAPQVRAMLDAMEKPPNIPQVSSRITYTDLLRGFQKWREATSTSPSGRHLGMYRSFLSSIAELGPDSPMGEHLLDLLADLLDVTVNVGYSMKRWHSVHTTMFEKDPGSPKLHRLRVIHLLEADYNLVLKIIFARRMVWNAEDHRALGDSQAGSRPGRCAIDVALQKALTYETALTTKTNLATFDNDATGCYDRIITALAMIACRRLGVPESACLLQAITLASMIYYIKTARGISSGTYTNTIWDPIFGTGQGSCASPALWLAISIILLQALSLSGHGVRFESPTKEWTHERHADAFVDDATLVTNDQTELQPQTPYTLARNLEHSAQIWRDLLFASGGDLELKKCFYYILHWYWDEGYAKPLFVDEFPFQLMINNHAGRLMPIEQKEVDEYHRTLGVRLNPLCQMDGEFDYMKSKGDKFAELTLTSPFTRQEADTAYKTTYLASIGYSITVTTFDPTQCRKIEQKAISAFLQRTGFPKSFPRVMVNGPTNFGGKAYRPLLIEQGIAKVRKIVMHLRQGSELGKQMRILLDFAQLRSGLGRSIWIDTATPIKDCYSDSPWIYSVRKFLSIIGGELHIANIFLPAPQRIGDITLMDLIRGECNSPTTLERFNQVRMYHQILYTSDMTDGAGTHFRRAFFDDPVTGTNHLTSTLRWPRQGRPSPKAFKTWRSLISKHLLVPRSPTLPLQTERRLGAWITPAQQLHRPWRYLFSPDQGLSVHVAGYWYCYPDFCSTRTAALVSTTTRRSIDHPSPNATPASITPTQHGDYRITYSTMTPEPRTQPSSTTLRAFFRRDPIMKKMLPLLTFPGTGQAQLQSALTNNETLWVVSDGGGIPKTTKGSFGFVIANATAILMEGSGPVPRGTEDMNSFRAETCGGWIAFWALRQFCAYETIELPNPTPIRFSCDNDASLKRLEKATENSTRHNPSTRLRADFDMDAAAQSHMCQFNVTYHEVTGHQDRTLAWEELSWPEQLNYRADELATAQLERPNPNFRIPLLPTTVAELRLAGLPVTNHYSEQLRFRAGFPALKKYIMSKHDSWTETTWQSIDWDAHGAALRHIQRTLGRSSRMQKFLAGKLPVGNITRHYAEGNESRCPSCQSHHHETEDHLFRCTDPDRRASRGASLTYFAEQLKDINTDPDLHRFILAGIHRWIQLGNSDYRTTRPHLKTLALSQRNIGWPEIIRGRISKGFAIVQERHFRRNHCNPKTATGPIWAKKFILLVWDLFEDVWKVRNDALHDDDPSAKRARLLHDTQDKVRHLYLRSTTLSARDRTFFSVPIATRLTEDVRTLTNWIRQIEPLLDTIEAEQLTRPDLSQRSLHHYFPALTS